MDKSIDYLEDLSVELRQLSGLCNVLCCVGESNTEPSWESVGDSFRAIRDVLDAKAEEAEEVVSEWYRAQAVGTVINP